jgi:hypothetical protein
MPRSLLAAVVAALAVLAPAAVAHAAPTLSFDQPCYSPGDGMGFSGSGYTPGGEVNLFFSAEGRFGSYGIQADAAGNLADTVRTPDPDDFVDDDDFSTTMTVTADDKTRMDAGAPPEEQFGAAQFILSRWEVELEQPGGAPPRARKPMRVTAVGFTHARGEMLYAHYTRGGKRLKSVRLGRLDDECGDRTRTLRRALPRGLRPGRYRLVFNASASNRGAWTRDGSASSCQRHERPVVPGMFMRASPPRPSTSCACTIATRAGEAKARRMSDHHDSRSRTPAWSIVASTIARSSSSSESYQPRTVSWSCVPV